MRKIKFVFTILAVIVVCVACNSGSSVKTNPVSDLSLLKTTLFIDSVGLDRVTFHVVLEAKKDVEIIGLEALYFDKVRKTSRTSSGSFRKRNRSSGSSSTATLSSELGSFDLINETLVMKAGEKKEFPAFFTISEIKNTHFVEINGYISEPFPTGLSLQDSIKRVVSTKLDKESNITCLEKIKKDD
ncbi:MAG: hypothetical protein IAF38_07445 [Bacteroidia bacterium]|nr:hypothetical protein [Bacteroidia bacterium]